MPYVLFPDQDPVTGQYTFTIPEGTPANLKRRVANEDRFWAVTNLKAKNGKKQTFYLVDNDFAYIEAFTANDIFSLPSDPSSYTFMPAPYMEGHTAIIDQRSRTNVLAVIKDPSGALL